MTTKEINEMRRISEKWVQRGVIKEHAAHALMIDPTTASDMWSREMTDIGYA